MENCFNCVHNENGTCKKKDQKIEGDPSRLGCGDFMIKKEVSQ